MITENGERPHKGPAVEMRLGGGHTDLCQQRPLEASEGETQLDPFEDGLVEEEEGLSFVSLVVGAYWFSHSTGANRD